MRWYVSRAGETQGPVEEGQVVAWVRAGMSDGMVRDEAGGPWTPLAQSPFGAHLPRPKKPENRFVAALAVSAATALAGLVVYGFNGAIVGAVGGLLLGALVGNARIG